ncbi:MAG: hypothetical protein AMS21_04800 [Gemmatimonas sp. SG8_38_2]|nr:MAG: hypothetical protein AMS21_04800 [Gemmatimonas sp. SG8_38_2]
MSRLQYGSIILSCLSCLASCTEDATGPGDGLPPGMNITVDHTAATLDQIPTVWIEQAAVELVIAYGHTSHGSQLVTGMQGLVAWKGPLYAFNATGASGALQLRDNPFSGAADLGNPDRTAWASATRTYLDAHPEVNVVLWSWCGQVSTATERDIETYLALMLELEEAYPAVRFVYMTGHLDGTGTDGNLHLRNEQIRRFCHERGRNLYDFADIESYDPDGAGYLAKAANDNCDYDEDGDGQRERNWALQWQDSHPGEWFSCSAAAQRKPEGLCGLAPLGQNRRVERSLLTPCLQGARALL